jgi:hypothetical protein
MQLYIGVGRGGEGKAIGAAGIVLPGHKVHTYTEYHSVCLLVGIGTLPPPLSPESVTLPTEPK